MTPPLTEDPLQASMATDLPTLGRTQLDLRRTSSSATPAKGWLSMGIFFLVLGVYALSSPGRIDSVDGQARFDVSYNWLTTGKPIIRDPWIGSFASAPGRYGFRYSFYGAPGSVFAMPLVWLGLYTSAPNIQPSLFLFSLTSTFFGAGIAVILFLLYLELGTTIRDAILWTLVSSFTTLVWPASTSTLDNAQHAFFVLAAIYCGFLAAKQKSAVYSVLGGFLGGVLILYQEYFVLIVPALALVTLQWGSNQHPASLPAEEDARKDSIVTSFAFAVEQTFRDLKALISTAFEKQGEARSSCLRYCFFVGAISVDVALAMAYNSFRFGSFLGSGKFHPEQHFHPPLLGNPLAGFLTLLVSPGKSVFLYSPPLILGLFGIGALWRRRPELAATIAATSVTLVLFLSCISFAGGDWCWGPRYLTPLLPLWALCFPFLTKVKNGRKLAIAVISAGLLVQLLGLSVENQRFFFEKSLKTFFWAEDPWVYFKHSALYSRIGETLSLFQGVPPTAHVFNSLPIPNWTTYVSLGPTRDVPLSQTPLWLRNFQVYFLPRPWPLWMASLKDSLHPVNLHLWLEGVLGLAMLGVGLIVLGLKKAGAHGANLQP